MRWRWPWRRAEDTGDARTHLRELEQRDAEVAQLGATLREQQGQNNFSGMVAAAIARRIQRSGVEGG